MQTVGVMNFNHTVVGNSSLVPRLFGRFSMFLLTTLKNWEDEAIEKQRSD